MKVEVGRDKFTEAVQLSERITGKNPTLPVLRCILLSANGSSLTLRATNLDLGIEIDLEAMVSREGVVAVPAHTIAATLSTVPSKSTITLEVEGGNLTIDTKQSHTLIKGQPYSDFPTLPTITNGKSVHIKTDLLVKGIRSVWYSASTSSIKPELASIYVTGEPGKFIFAATDSFRLAEKKIEERGLPAVEQLIIPIRNIPEIIRSLETIGGTADILFNKNQLSISLGSVYLTSRLIDAAFPDYHQIIPKEPLVEVTVLKHDFLSALKKAVIFSDSFNQLSFTIKPNKKLFSMSARGDAGEMQETIPAALKGEALDINFNHRYLADCLQSIPQDSITLSFSGAGKPLLVRGAGDPTFLYLVMPMNR